MKSPEPPNKLVIKQKNGFAKQVLLNGVPVYITNYNVSSYADYWYQEVDLSFRAGVEIIEEEDEVSN